MNSSFESLEQLLCNQTGIWRGLRAASPDWATLETGLPELDELLPGGGWPLGALLEIQSPCMGLGELRMLLPAMAKLSQAGRCIAWVEPPHQPYAPGLVQAGIALPQILVVECKETDDIPWALEKLLRNRHCGMALAWPQSLSDHQTRRLQLAAEQGHSLAVLFPRRRGTSRHAALRIELRPTAQGLLLTLLKARGSLHQASLLLPA